ncbi:MAG: hypothetical protein AB1717_00560 [Pseudomonadota bacterium]
MLYVYLLVVAVFLLVAWVVNSTLVRSINSYLNKEYMLMVVSQIDEPGFMEKYAEAAQWAEINSYTHECYFLFRTTKFDPLMSCSAWWSEREKTWFMLYFSSGSSPAAQGEHAEKSKAEARPAKTEYGVEFSTAYENELNITTSSLKGSLLLPMSPGKYVQCFDKLSIAELHEKHMQACSALAGKNPGLKPVASKGDLMQLLAEHFQSTARHVMSIPFWKYRGIFWWLVRQNVLRNKPLTFRED